MQFSPGRSPKIVTIASHCRVDETGAQNKIYCLFLMPFSLVLIYFVGTNAVGCEAHTLSHSCSFNPELFVIYCLFCAPGEAVVNVTLNATSQARGRLLLYHREDWRDASEDSDCVRRLGKARILCESCFQVY